MVTQGSATNFTAAGPWPQPMYSHNIRVQGVELDGQAQTVPVILQMNDDDFPGRFLADLAAGAVNPISSTTTVEKVQPTDEPTPVLFQPVQRIAHLAMVQLSCESVGSPMLDPRRIESAGLVIRRVNGDGLSAWMRSPRGQCQWVPLNSRQECLDPDPAKRPSLYSGQPGLDEQLAALTLANANTEVSTPAFAAPPDICAALNRTIVYAWIPTASSEVSDTAKGETPLSDKSQLANNLPALLQAGNTMAPASGQTVDYRWMSDDYLDNPSNNIDKNTASQFRVFATALRMLNNVFGAFDPPPANSNQQQSNILQDLNQQNVQNVTVNGTTHSSMGMGDFFQAAKTCFLDLNTYPNTPTNPPQIVMPATWDTLQQNVADQLLNDFMTALIPRAQSTVAAQGRFQDRTALYQLRLFFRVKREPPSSCPSQLVWSPYSNRFRIAAWYETGDRAHPPVPLPDPTAAFLSKAKPNCSFHVPASLMGAMQGTSMSGLMSGSGGGPPLTLDWICGFNIPLITICAFFVLSIFLALLNIIFFWLPFIKICIPFPPS